MCDERNDRAAQGGKDHRAEELSQLCETVRAVENVLWVAAAAYLAIVGFGINWMYAWRAEVRLQFIVLAGLLVFQGLPLWMQQLWVRFSTHMLARIAKLAEMLGMDVPLAVHLRATHRCGARIGFVFFVLAMVATVGVFAVTRVPGWTCDPGSKREPMLVRLVSDTAEAAGQPGTPEPGTAEPDAGR
ncbi:hypothetical protein FJY71_02820 [candidate division WOR-3 bacterium]|nr:hypothetical protein [candidate division WOR-3 bacterium]